MDNDLSPPIDRVYLDNGRFIEEILTPVHRFDSRPPGGNEMSEGYVTGEQA